MTSFSPNQIKKLQLVYFPFLKVSLSILILYTLSHWYFSIYLEKFSWSENTVNAWIPAILTIGLVLISLRSKARLLTSKPDSVIILMIITILIPTIIMQFYIVTATGKLTVLNDISEKSSVKSSKYYIIKNHFIDKKYASFKSLVNIEGKRNRDYYMYLYCALPILKNEADTTQSTYENWYCVKYYERISNKLSSEIKKQKFDVFLTRSFAKFDSLNINNFVYLNRIEQIFDKNGYCQAIKSNKRFISQQPSILLPINEPFEQRNGAKLYWFLGTFITLNLCLIMFIFKHDLKENIALE